MPIQTAKASRTTYIFYSIVLMLVSLLISRAALSISIIIFLALTIVHKNFLQQLKDFCHDRLLLLVSLLFFMPLISGLWCNDVEQWGNVVRLKLPFLFLPLAFAGRWKLSEKRWLMIALCFLAVVSAGSVCSLINYLSDASAQHENYLRAKTFDTLLENDHVRFSWLVAVAVICSVLLLQKNMKVIGKKALIVLSVFFIVYLHLLAARMGLAALYIFLFLLAIRYIFLLKKPVLSFAIVAMIFLLPFAAWLTLPTFQNRIKYLMYDLETIENNAYTPGSNDGARLLSIKAGWHVLKQNPLGAGAGDITAEINKWYNAHVPQVIATDKFYPSNEWLMHGGFAGWPGVLLFSLIIAFPFAVKKIRNRFYWMAFNIIAAFSFLFDMSLEVQYGIFLYSFILLWWYKWFKAEADA